MGMNPLGMLPTPPPLPSTAPTLASHTPPSPWHPGPAHINTEVLGAAVGQAGVALV